MILGMSLQTFVLVHTAISLVAIATGFIVLIGFFTGKRFEEWTAIFLLTTLLTSVTGFMLPPPITTLLPSQITGIVALVVLVPTLLALYVFGLEGRWRTVYVVGAVISLYLNVFVLVVQLFLKVDFLHALAPTQSELPFVASQAVVLIAFCALGFVSAVRFHPEPLEA
jgi:hypothetical protein